MFCRICGDSLAHSINICEACDSSQSKGNDASTRSATLQQERLLAQAASLSSSSSQGTNQSSLVEFTNAHPSSPTEAHPARQEQLVKQLEMVMQKLHRMESNFKDFIEEQAATHKVQHITATQQPIPSLRKIILQSLPILLPAAIGLLWFLYQLVIYIPRESNDVIAIITASLTIIGSIYLAYRMLDRLKVLLRWVAIFLTGGLAGVMVVEPFMIYELRQPQGLPNALHFALCGALLGAYGGTMLCISTSREKRPLQQKSTLFGMIGGVLFSLAFFSTFIMGKGYLSRLIHVEFDVPIILCGLFIGAILGILQHQLFHKFPLKDENKRPREFSWRAGAVCFVLWIVTWTTLLKFSGYPLSLYSLPFDLLVGMESAFLGGRARYIYWYLRNGQPDHLLEIVGLLLLLSACLLQLAQPIAKLISAIG